MENGKKNANELPDINTKKYHVFAPMGRFQLESTAQARRQK